MLGSDVNNAAVHRCTQCSHRTVWPFQLDHHIQRKHRNVYAAELFHAGIEPEAYSCLCCGSKSRSKLARYEHCKHQHVAASGVDETADHTIGREHFNDEFEWWPCDYCNYECDSVISLAKHHDSCEMAPSPEGATENAAVSAKESHNATTEMQKNSRIAAPQVIRDFQCAHCSYRYSGNDNLLLKRHVIRTHADDDDDDGITWFDCGKCSYSTRRKDHLNRHLLRRHSTMIDRGKQLGQHADNDATAIATTQSLNSIAPSSVQDATMAHDMMENATVKRLILFKCSKCSYCARRKNHLKKHVLRRHATSNDAKQLGRANNDATAVATTHKLDLIAPQVHDDATIPEAHGKDKEVAKDKDIAWFTCNKCSYRTRRKDSLKRHVSLQHVAADEINLFDCSKCSYRAKRKDQLKRHLLQRHDVTDGATSHNLNLKKYYLKMHMFQTHATTDDDKQVGHSNDATAALATMQNLDLIVPRVHDGSTIPEEHGKDKDVAKDEDFTWYTCNKCSYRAKRKDGLKRHISLQHAAADEINWFDCSKCSYRAKRKDLLKRHLLLRHSTNDDDKQLGYANNDATSVAMTQNLDLIAPRVHDDATTTPDQHGKDKEVAKDEDLAWFNCNKCFYRARRKDGLKRHISLQHAAADEINWFDCSKCSYRAKRKDLLKKHLLRRHATTDGDLHLGHANNDATDAATSLNLNLITPRMPDDATTSHMVEHATADKINWLYCAQCSYKSKTKGTLKKHMLVHAAADEINWSSCDKCVYRTKKPSYLKVHMLIHAAPEEISWLNCTECDFRTRHKKSLKLHMIEHARPEEITWFRCTKCPYRATRKSSLRQHQMRHATVDEIKWKCCSKCSYRAKTPKDLRRHMCQHADESDWLTCAECAYRAKSNETMKLHKLMVHTAPDEIVWFNCDKCPYRSQRKSFVANHALNVHAAADEITWFRCAHCSYRSKQKAALKVHILQHATADEIDWLTCTKCSYRTKRRAYLRQHELTHAADEEIDWFSCDKCSYRAKQKRYLRSHVLTHTRPEAG